MVIKRTLPALTTSQQWLFDQAMQRLDAVYDADSHMITYNNSHDLRDTSHYVLGLLFRNQGNDFAEALAAMKVILDSQYSCGPDMAFYGGFPYDDRDPEPPCEPFPGTHFDAVSRFFLEKWMESIREDFAGGLSDSGFNKAQIQQIGAALKTAVKTNVPVVWDTFDPNWREFEAIEFALILALFSDRLPTELIAQIKTAMEKSVEGSLCRYENHVVPMNTNIELMHVFVCSFYGAWLDRPDLSAHAKKAAHAVAEAYRAHHSFAEYNSTTYYSVDLTVLAMWRDYLDDQEISALGTELEAELWKDIAAMYHPLLDNVCGPFSRSYEIDMHLHSMLPAYLYMVYGPEKVKEPLFNIETAGFLDLALLGTQVPQDVYERLLTFDGPRTVHACFPELMERGMPGDDTTLCDVNARMEENWMAGVLSGSRNTSGQLRPAVVFWKAPDDSVSNLAIMRREPGTGFEHIRDVFFNAVLTEQGMDITVTPVVHRKLEVYFEIDGTDLTAEMIQGNVFQLPGMTVDVTTDAGAPKVQTIDRGLEVIYTWEPGMDALHFHLDLTWNA